MVCVFDTLQEAVGKARPVSSHLILSLLPSWACSLGFQWALSWHLAFGSSHCFLLWVNNTNHPLQTWLTEFHTPFPLLCNTRGIHSVLPEGQEKYCRVSVGTEWGLSWRHCGITLFSSQIHGKTGHLCISVILPVLGGSWLVLNKPPALCK